RKPDGSLATTQQDILAACATSTPTPTPTSIQTSTPTPTPTSSYVDYCGPLDVNGDNKIDIVDFASFARKYNTECKAPV
ncbi:MAG: hypothetical protein NZZ41_06200, partial [Candidatus Dojkabacteria bacterium]|nr:hypothetical protein [Candidatus Dojkabacteria bacterium]